MKGRAIKPKTRHDVHLKQNGEFAYEVITWTDSEGKHNEFISFVPSPRAERRINQAYAERAAERAKLHAKRERDYAQTAGAMVATLRLQTIRDFLNSMFPEHAAQPNRRGF